ncbi:MAG: hypothetical protein AAFR11_15150 [Pseudomonadota bacterium]
MNRSGFRMFEGVAGSGPGWRFARPSDLKDADAIIDEELERLMDARPAGKLGALDATLKIAFFLGFAIVPGLFVSLAIPSWQEGEALGLVVLMMAAAAGGVWAIGRAAERSFIDAAEKLGFRAERAKEFYRARREPAQGE